MQQTDALPLGFLWGAVRAGIKASGNLDVALAFAPKGANAAAMFTRNQVVAAPVIVGRSHLAATGGRIAAVLVNAGNANCATGEAGMRACLATCTATAEAFGCTSDQVFPSSTGIIGVPFPAEKVVASLPLLQAALGNSAAHAEAFASAIITTDTRMKLARAVFTVGDRPVTLFGVAKGAGMIHPRLGLAATPAHATMLVYLFTDLAAEPAELEALLPQAVEQTFNCMSIDGDTSTNDTVLLLASGASGVQLDAGGVQRNPSVRDSFREALRLVSSDLAHQVIDDGEGVGHVVTLQVNGARTFDEARQVARAIAHSPLNKTAWSSADPNWGRLLAAAGNSGVRFDPDRLVVRIGAQVVFEHGMRAAHFDEALAHRTMGTREYTITLDLAEGEESCTFLTCDLTEEYVRINADYST